MIHNFRYEAVGNTIVLKHQGRQDQVVGTWPDEETAKLRASEYNENRDEIVNNPLGEEDELWENER